MATYSVEWRIDIEADTREEAARKAWEHMRRSDSTANHFYVYDEDGECEEVDLQELDEAKEPTILTVSEQYDLGMLQAIRKLARLEGLSVHHIDGNPNNNSLDNLRIVAPEENRR